MCLIYICLYNLLKTMKLILTLLLLININLYSQIEKNYLNGKKEFEAKKFESALTNFNKVIEKNTHYKDVINLRGLTFLYLQEFDSALADFNKFIKFNPKSADAYNNRGLAFGYLDMPDSAKASFDIAVKLDPKFPQALINIAFIYVNIYTNDSAMIFFDKALAIDKNLPEAYFQKGKLFKTKKMYNEAIDNFNLAISKGYNKDECYLLIGNILFKQGKFQEAVNEYSKAIKANSKNVEALNNRALSNDTLGNKSDAKKDRERLNEINKPYIVDFSNVVYKKYFNSDSTISLDLPEAWVQEESIDSNSTKLILLPDSKNNATNYFAKVTLAIERNMKERFNVFTEAEQIGFWKSSSNENAKGYKIYDVLYEKSKPFKKYGCVEFLSRFQINPTMPIIKQYEFTLYKDGIMFYGFFQCFDYQYQFFKDVYEKSMLSIEVKM